MTARAHRVLGLARLERCRGCEATLIVGRWWARPRAFHLPPLGLDEDEPASNSPLGDLSPIVEHTEEPPAPALSVPPSVPSAPPTTAQVAPAPVPQASMPSIPQEPSAPMPTARSDIVEQSTYTPPKQFIIISTRDFRTIMEAVRSFSITAASFTSSQTTLADRMTHTEAAVAQNQAILMQLQSHLSLPAVSPHAPAQSSATPPPTGSAPPPPAPTNPLDALTAAAASTTTPAAPQLFQAEDDSLSATD